jgi:hypothetical protein
MLDTQRKLLAWQIFQRENFFQVEPPFTYVENAVHERRRNKLQGCSSSVNYCDSSKQWPPTHYQDVMCSEPAFGATASGQPAAYLQVCSPHALPLVCIW